MLSLLKKTIEQAEHSTFIVCIAAELTFILFLIAIIIFLGFRLRKVKEELLAKKKELKRTENLLKIERQDHC